MPMRPLARRGSMGSEMLICGPRALDSLAGPLPVNLPPISYNAAPLYGAEEEFLVDSPSSFGPPTRFPGLHTNAGLPTPK